MWRRSWRAGAHARSRPKPKGGGRSTAPKHAPASSDADAENKVLRQRVEAARERVHELLQRLTFLEVQAREPASGSK